VFCAKSCNYFPRVAKMARPARSCMSESTMRRVKSG
jgi:hypothetical protein